MTRNERNRERQQRRDSKITSKSRNTSTKKPLHDPSEPRIRAVIEGVKPEIDGGRFPIKRVVGDRVVVEADIFTDGHDALSARLLYRAQGDADWQEASMEPLVNDRWQGVFCIAGLTDYYYTLEAWVDRFRSWLQGFSKKVAAEQDVTLELIEGAELIDAAAKRRMKHGQPDQRQRLGELDGFCGSPSFKENRRRTTSLRSRNLGTDEQARGATLGGPLR